MLYRFSYLHPEVKIQISSDRCFIWTIVNQFMIDQWDIIGFTKLLKKSICDYILEKELKFYSVGNVTF